MKTFRFSCCQVYQLPNETDYIVEILVIINGLITPQISAENRTEAMVKLYDWFIEHKCRPYQEV